jgi:hexokinase
MGTVMSECVIQKDDNLNQALQALKDCFSISVPEMLVIAEKFHADMHKGLAGQKGPLKMLPSFLDTPSGGENGVFLSVDFGGTNVRVSLVSLQGNGEIKIFKRKSVPLKDPGGGYDYTSADATGQELFCFLAEQISNFISPGVTIFLGHTFSFPTKMYALNKAVLIGWTKEFKTRLAEGRDVNELLEEALKKHGLHGVKPVAVTNDTVATLLAAAYGDPHVDIGSICGTGHNTCYLEPLPLQGQGPMIFNIEAGNFDALPGNVYDRQLDSCSEKPGEQVLEKMVSGRYLGELMRLVVLDLVQQGLLFQGRAGNMTGFPFKPHTLSPEQMSAMISDDTKGLIRTASWLYDVTGIQDPPHMELGAFKTIASLLSARSARLVAATYIGILQHLDPLLTKPHTIAIDGSLYEKMAGYAHSLRTALDEVLKDRAGQVAVRFIKDGSGIGAAIAAAIAAQNKARPMHQQK